MDGEQFSGGTGEKDFFTVYNGGGFIEGFADGIVGAMPGEVVEVNLTFPENYYEDLAGKPVTFKVTVKHIYVPAELTDENAVKLTGNNEMTVEKLMAECREMLEADTLDSYKEKKAKLIIAEIIKAAELSSPHEKLVEKYYNADVEYYQYYADYYGISYEAILEQAGMTDQMLRERAEANVMKDIAVYAIIRAENIKLDEGEYDVRLEALAKLMGYSKEDIEKSYTKEELTEQFTYNKACEVIESWQNTVTVTE